MATVDTEGSREPNPILAINENGANLHALSAMLGRLGRRIVTARSEREALEVAAEETFAVILLDVVASETEAFETVTRLREQPPARRTPLILLTGHEPNRSALNLIQRTGLVDYVLKPVPAELLRNKIAPLLSLEVQERIVRRHETALAAKDRTIAILAHDLQNPIGALITATDLLARRGPDERFPERVRNFSRIVRRLSEMVRTLTDYARAGRGRLPIAPAPMNVGELCTDVVAEFQQSSPSAAIALRCEGDLNGIWDPTRLYQALSNLLRNALRYGAGGVLVRASGRSTHVEIAVHNDGSPIPRQQLSAIFQPFARGRRSGDGLGLGLFIVEEVATSHGGDVWVRSSAKRGTTFTLRLPRLGQRLAPRRAPNRAPPRPTPVGFAPADAPARARSALQQFRPMRRGAGRRGSGRQVTL